MSDLSIQQAGITKKMHKLQGQPKATLATTTETASISTSKEAQAISAFEMEFEETNRAFALVVEIRKQLEAAYEKTRSQGTEE